MEIWIILNGEKAGPLHDFDVRRKIESGEADADTPAWHEGLDSWRPLGRISMFEGEFEAARNKPAGPGHHQTAPTHRMPPPLPGKSLVMRRFWARWLDLFAYSGVWWITMWLAKRDIGGILENPWIILFQFVPWFVLESLMLSRISTTPGKWLLGLRVVNDDGSPLSLGQAVTRSSRVLFLGVGFGFGLIALVCQLMALVTTKRLGRPLWDHAAGHRVTSTPLDPIRISAYVVTLFVSLQLQFIVVAPYAMENTLKMFPQLKEHLEKNPPWHLPER